KSVLGRLFRDKALRIAEALLSSKPEDVQEQLKEQGFVLVEGYQVPRDAVKVVEVEEKISGEKIIPHVVEPSYGVDRVAYVTMEYAYRERDGRVILAFPRDVAPVQAVVLPLLENDDNLVREARILYRHLVEEGFTVLYDESGSIGRRYARADEIGVPAALTVDYQTLEDGTVTLRDRDTWRQVRVDKTKVVDALRRFLRGAKLEDLGALVSPPTQQD
ncbi:MAG: His/Gly/Thr/Pro-type tRNA ligase C-terminal domain-containing protein, partial [Acidilobaceae archaeon]